MNTCVHPLLNHMQCCHHHAYMSAEIAVDVLGYNDIMLLKRNIIEVLQAEGINKFILIGENVLNFHGSDDSYYEEWLEEVEEGWMACVSFPDFLCEEMAKYNLDTYLNMGGTLEIEKWRTLTPSAFYLLISGLISRRLSI